MSRRAAAQSRPRATGSDDACGTRGRPRSTEADHAILDAANDLFADHGYDGLTIEAVAAQAGVAKSTVYRRYPNKLALLLAAAEHAKPSRDAVPDTGSLEGDLFDLARTMRGSYCDSALGRTIPAGLAAAAKYPEVAEAHGDAITARRRLVHALVDRAVARGEVDPEIDPDLAIDLVIGPIFYRAFVTRATLDDELLAELARRAARALASA